MSSDTKLAEHLSEIRRQVCSRCIERPPGGPPCLPLGKACAIELHLPALVEAVRAIESPLMAPYIDQMHQQVCATCPQRGQEGCPCPAEYLLTLLVQAIETIDQRRESQPA
jgi:hypothetical protein